MLRFLQFTLLMSMLTGTGNADELILHQGGRVVGDILNPDESPRKTYVVSLGDGSEITLDAAQVKQVRIKSEAEKRYDRLLPNMPETADGHWKMSQWCRSQKLDAKEQHHLDAVLRHDPEHELARRRLGFSRIDGNWVQPEEWRQKHGYTWYKKRWRPQQDVEVIKRQEDQKQAEKDWRAKIKRWRGWLGRRQSATAERELAAIRDPSAAPALAELLPKEKDRRVKSLYIEILGRIESPTAARALALCALEDENEEIRLSCLDQLQGRKLPQVVDMFIQRLRSNNNAMVNRAAVGLARMKDGSAIPYLIDVLTTQHKVRVNSNPGQIGVGFGRDGGPTPRVSGFQYGGGPRVRERLVRNRHVLDALISLTDGVNFQYDKERWRRWYIKVNAPKYFNLRRGE